MLGYNPKYDAITNFALDRIIFIQKANVTFIPNTKYDFEEFFKNVIGVSLESQDDPVEEVLIEVDGQQYPYVSPKPMHTSQKLVRYTPEGNAIISLNVVPNFELSSEADELADSLTEEEQQEYMEGDDTPKLDKAKIKKNAKSKTDDIDPETKTKLKRFAAIWDEQSKISKAIKEEKQALIDKTKEAIEGLTDDEVERFLHLKWIDPVCEGIEMLSVTMNQGIIKASENGRFDNSNSDKSHYKVVKVNVIAYNSMRMWQGASGCSPYDGIVSPAYTVVTPVEGIDPHFFACLFKTPSVIKLFRLSSQGLVI